MSYKRMETDKYREMELSVLRTMFFHFIELLFTAGLSSTPQTNLQRRFRGDGDHDNMTYPYNQTDCNGTYPGYNQSDPYAVADNAAQASADHASLVRRAVIGSVVGGVGLMLFLLLGFFFLRRRRRRRLAVVKVLEDEKDGAVLHRDLRHSESEEGTSTEEHFVVTGKNMVRLVPPPGHADEGQTGREPPPAYRG